MKTTSKIEQLENLRQVLNECKEVYVRDEEEWNALNDMLIVVCGLLTKEQRKEGWMAVYPIVDGCSREALFEGTSEECDIYVETLLEVHPEMKGEIIVLQL